MQWADSYKVKTHGITRQILQHYSTILVAHIDFVANATASDSPRNQT